MQRDDRRIKASFGRRAALAIVAAALCPSLAPSALASELPSAETVLHKYAQAIGGEAIGKVSNMEAQFHFSMPMQGVEADGVEYWQAPASYSMKINLVSMGVSDYKVGVIDGWAWESHPMNGTRRLEGAEAQERQRRASLNPFASWKTDFEKAETVAEEKVAGKPCYKVVLTPAVGSPLSAWFDADSGLLLQEETTDPSGSPVTIELGDYEETQGIRSARTVTQTGTTSYTLTYTSVAYDVEDLPADAFEPPPGLEAPSAE
jgi:zinc protease